jgi:hypothetical protein
MEQKSPLLTGQQINRRSLQLRAAGGDSNCFVLPFLIEGKQRNFPYPPEHHFEKKMFFKRKKVVLWASGRPLHGCRHSLHVGLLTMKSFRISPPPPPSADRSGGGFYSGHRSMPPCFFISIE